MPSVRRLVTVAVVAALCSTVVASADAGAEWDADPLNTQVVLRHHYLCGADDLPEEGIQGDVSKADQQSGRAEQGYNCGLALVGHTRLNAGGRPEAGNANMAWAGSCAYVAGPGGGVVPQVYTPPAAANGVAVVDVSNSARPKHVATLRTPGAAATLETVHAVTTPSGRSILVVGQYGNDVAKTGPKPMDIYDVSNRDCTKVKLMATYDWPTNAHNLTISPDGKYVFATIPLQVVDISGLWDDPTPTLDPATKVKYLGNIQDVMDGPPVATGPSADLDDPLFDNLPDAAAGETTHPQNVSHEAWPSPDFATNPEHQWLYVGGQTPEFELFTVLDLRAWLQRNPDGTLRDPNAKPVVVSQQSGRGHSVRTATIGGKPYVLHSEESVFGAAYGCIPEYREPVCRTRTAVAHRHQRSCTSGVRLAVRARDQRPAALRRAGRLRGEPVGALPRRGRSLRHHVRDRVDAERRHPCLRRTRSRAACRGRVLQPRAVPARGRLHGPGSGMGAQPIRPRARGDLVHDRERWLLGRAHRRTGPAPSRPRRQEREARAPAARRARHRPGSPGPGWDRCDHAAHRARRPTSPPTTARSAA